MNKYKVVFETDYKRTKVRESYIIEADNEEEALDLVYEGLADKESEEIIQMGDTLYDEHISTEKIEENE